MQRLRDHSRSRKFAAVAAGRGDAASGSDEGNEVGHAVAAEDVVDVRSDSCRGQAKNTGLRDSSPDSLCGFL